MSVEQEVLTRSEQVYSPLGNYLRTVSPREDAAMSFSEVEEVISRPLPRQARQNVSWWDSVPKKPQSRAWLRADRRASVDLSTETVTFIFAVFQRGWSVEQLKRMRSDWLTFARGELADPRRLSHVELGWWEPHHVYLLHYPADAAYKVGITRVDSTRIAKLTGSRGRLVDRLEVANRWAALVVESHVLELVWDAWKQPDRFATGDQGETERWSDWLVPPPLSVVRDSLTEDQKSPGWEMSVFRRES
ncbi:hypothetical protein [Microbacterium memoriense]|uniref:GIY-YIG nuclease family protein n=1 Tax=Microbacterium memoriense TaxID=2978350 RepID=A0ABT2PB86_9MICO|nr:hypothetical protein [Microbacterium memoriense]MCT9001689.1 hypothetical protein [Microbacterium memoriense]